MMTDFGIFSDGNSDNRERLRERAIRIVDANADAIIGKKVLDIAANNGRWTYAALNKGAEMVVSIEGRGERVDDARQFLDGSGFSGRYRAHVGDMFDFLYDNRDQKFDTVLCLGVYYHIMDHSHLLRLMARLRPETIIIDSGFVRSFRDVVHIQSENPGLHLNALSVYEGQTHEPVGFISLGLMLQLAWNQGYSCRPVLWDPKEVSNPRVVHDYMLGRRFTLRLDKMDGRFDPEWQAYWKEALTLLDPRFGGLFDKNTHDRSADDRARRPIENAQFSVI